jgi:putative transcriptional regulator
MPIQSKLEMVMTARRISLIELSGRVKITQANLSHLKRGKARAIRFSTLEALCETLRCQPADLLEYLPDAGAWKEKPIDLISILKRGTS